MFKNIIIKTVYYLFPSIFKTLSFFITIPIITFYFNPEELGLYYFIMSILLVATPLSHIGIEWVLQSNFYKLKKKELKIFLFNAAILDLILRIFWSSIIYLIFITYGNFLVSQYSEEYNLYLLIILISFCTNFLWTSLSQSLILRKKAKIFSIIECSRISTYLIILLVLLFIFKLGFVSLFLVHLITNFLIIFLEFFYLKKDIILKINFNRLKEIIIFGYPLTFTSLSSMGLGFFDKFIIQKYFGFYNTGIYGHSQSYSNLFSQILKAYLRVITPVVTKDSTERHYENLNKINITTNLLNKVALFFGLFIIFYSEYFISFLTFGKFAESSSLVAVWYSLVFIGLISNTVMTILIVKKYSKFLMHTQIYLTFLVIFCIFYFINHLNILSIVYILVLRNFFVLMLRYLKTTEFVKINYLLNFLKYFFLYHLIFLINLNFNIGLYLEIILIIISGIDLYLYFINKRNEVNYLIKNV